MNMEIGTDASQFPEQEYINGGFVAVRTRKNGIENTVANLTKIYANMVQYRE